MSVVACAHGPAQMRVCGVHGTRDEESAHEWAHMRPDMPRLTLVPGSTLCTPSLLWQVGGGATRPRTVPCPD